MGAPAARVFELARHWVRSGHQVTVLTGFPNHPTGKIPDEYRRKFWGLTCRERIAGFKLSERGCIRHQTDSLWKEF